VKDGVRTDGGLLDGYEHDGFFDELVDSKGTLRPHCRELGDVLRAFSPDELARRERLRDAAFRTQGITFTVYGQEEGVERTFPMDLIPRIIPADEWAVIERGLIQRVTALNHFLDDLYAGDRAAVHDRIVPWDLLLTADGFVRQAFGIAVPGGARCLVAGIDLVRGADGVYYVLEDNLRNPSGISYVLENRSAMTRVMPVAFGAYRIRPVHHYGISLLAALRNVAPPAAGDPTVVVLTPGMHNSAYYEHAFLARQMGVELVEGRDLVVDEHVVFMRTTRGLQRVDVIYRRIDDDYLDPVVFHSGSMLGVPGLMGAARAGNVTIANAVGNGAADDKAVYTYVPDLIRYYLNEDPILPNVTTYRLDDPDQQAMALSRLEQLVVKPVAASGGFGMLVGPAASEKELHAFREKIVAEPRGYIAQEVVSLSRHPTLVDDHLEGRHIDLRPFVLSGETIEVIPGGLTRVALRRGSLVVNSSQGGGSKDTWVLAAPDEEAEPAPPSEGPVGR
jgi:uncharacterized circularly permuted ATP-grasp superfamily protein